MKRNNIQTKKSFVEWRRYGVHGRIRQRRSLGPDPEVHRHRDVVQHAHLQEPGGRRALQTDSQPDPNRRRRTSLHARNPRFHGRKIYFEAGN